MAAELEMSAACQLHFASLFPFETEEIFNKLHPMVIHCEAVGHGTCTCFGLKDGPHNFYLIALLFLSRQL